METLFSFQNALIIIKVLLHHQYLLEEEFNQQFQQQHYHHYLKHFEISFSQHIDYIFNNPYEHLSHIPVGYLHSTNLLSVKLVDLNFFAWITQQTYQLIFLQFQFTPKQENLFPLQNKLLHIELMNILHTFLSQLI